MKAKVNCLVSIIQTSMSKAVHKKNNKNQRAMAGCRADPSQQRVLKGIGDGPPDFPIGRVS